jgi:hypothetical protein
MKDKTQQESERFVFHQGDEGQISTRGREICLSLRMKDKTQQESERFVFHQGDEGQNSVKEREICLSSRG